MFEIINDSNTMIPETNVLNNYISYLVKKLSLDKCEFNIILTNNTKIHQINILFIHNFWHLRLIVRHLSSQFFPDIH